MFHNILCPVDFSPHALASLRHGFEIARRGQGRVTVLFVNDPLLSAAVAAAEYDKKTLASQTDTQLRRFVARAGGSDVPATLLTAAGHPAAEIELAAGRIAADLIVMGSHGLRGAGKWMFGSTTERTLRAARVPVLVVPRPRAATARARASALTAWPGKRAVVGVDLADYDVADVRRAVAIVREFGARPVLTYALPPARLPSWITVNEGPRQTAQVREARRRLEALALRLKGEIDTQVVIGDPAEELAVCTESARAGLVVLALKRGGALLGARRGAITYQLIARQVAPILALP